MTGEFVGVLVNKTTGVKQNVTRINPSEADAKGGSWDYVQVEGDTLYHSYKRLEYDFIPTRKTPKEQFDDLKIGDTFWISGSVLERVKVAEDKYYTVHSFWTIPENADIIKKED